MLKERDADGERANTLAEEWTNLADSGEGEAVEIRKITWMELTAKYIGRNIQVALMGLFERINPLKYEGKTLAWFSTSKYNLLF